MTSPSHSSMSGQSLHEDKRVKEPVRAASTANVNTSSPGTALDGVTLSGGDRILLKNQTTASQNGIYVWATSITALTRATDATAASDFVYGFLVYVREGTSNGVSWWTYTTTTTPTIGSTSLTFQPIVAGTGTVTSVALTVPAELSVTGSPITSSGTLAVSKASQTANTVASGPASGGSAAWGFRSLVPADLPLFGASGATHAPGAVVDPGGTAGTTRFLREDATWQVPSGTGGGTTSAGSGGSGALVPIAAIGPLTAPQATFSFSGIPQTGFRNLHIQLSARGTVSGGGLTNAVDVGIRANNDTTANYDWTNNVLYQGGASGFGAQADTAAYVAKIPATGATTNVAGTAHIVIADYGSATFQKSFASSGTNKVGTAASQQYGTNGGGFWRSVAGITDLSLLCVSGNFDVGSYACLYGEMDTAGSLLTPASNLLFDTTLTSAQATIDTGTLSGAYTDLQIFAYVRSDTAATATFTTLQINGDTGANYDYFEQLSADQGFGATAMHVGRQEGNTAPASTFSTLVLHIPAYTNTTGHKNVIGVSTIKLANTSGNIGSSALGGWWRSTAAVTSLKFGLVAGNFLAGTHISIYGLPLSAGGAATGTGTRLRISANQSTATGTATTINWDVEDNDADNQHYTSSAALTGTVTKTAASQTLAGSGTAFTTELSVGQVISVTGTATEKRVVIAIASATSLTVNSPFVNTQAGATATRLNGPVVFRQPGFYTLEANIYSAALASGAVSLAFYLNSLTTATSGTAIGQRDPTAINASAGYDLVVQRQFQQWDFIEAVWTQNAGTVNVLADERTHFSINARPTVIVGVPYVNLQDQKTSGTDGGGFTSGAWQRRDLNTVQADRSGIATLASNQFTLPVGTYRVAFSAPAYNCNRNLVRLQNITDSTTVQYGREFRADGSSNGNTLSSGSAGFTISASKTFEVQHWCETTRATDGFGRKFGDLVAVTEVYTVVEIWKEG